jgi:hypothetical protein
LFTGIALFYFGCSDNNPILSELSQSDLVTNSLAKPSPNLIGTANALFNFPPLPDPGGSDLPIFWKGTIDFGEDTYGIYFLSYDAPRDFSQASPFYEDFVIHEFRNEGNVYLRGWEAGVVTLANKLPDPSRVITNGKITEAYGPFVEWQGRNVHGSGLVYWEVNDNGIPTGLPERAESTIRIN